MNQIRSREDCLFEEWRKSYAQGAFVIDGCPNPEKYLASDHRIVFVLKDANLGNKFEGLLYDQRNELEFHPHRWWRTIGLWCSAIRYNRSWADHCDSVTDQSSIACALSDFAIIQLKKIGGVGAISNQSLTDTVLKDREMIRRQISIYEPNVVVACGNGNELIKAFSPDELLRGETHYGVGYWNVSAFDQNFIIIDYCHPSARVGTKIRGQIALGLGQAVKQVLETKIV